ncbi:MAG TPA: TQO small subunit DoxD [Chloroflexia bacterium]|nr:TQO small subunit DoxD [Chloroflexia bacterium]
MATTSRAGAVGQEHATGSTTVDTLAQQRVDDQRVPTWPLRIGSLVIGYLWFTQLLWKLPWNTFGSPGLKPNPTPSATQPGPFIDNGQGLYHWMTVEAIHGNKVLPFYGDLIKNTVLPNWEMVAWFTVLMETAIMASLVLGLFSRLGGLVGFVQAINLYLGLSRAPGEWDWSYGMLVTLGFIFMLTGPGRVWGVDAWLRPRFRRQIAAGNRLVRWLYLLT